MTDDFDRLRDAARSAQNILMRVGAEGGIASQIERGEWDSELTQQHVTDLADLLYAMSESVRYSRILADRLRSDPISGSTVGDMGGVTDQGLPLNRKERFYTGTVLPMIIAGDGFAHLHRFLALCGLQIEALDHHALDGGPNIEFFTEYNFAESRFTDHDRARFPDAPPDADTPDVVIVGPDWLVAVEAKVFHNPPPRALNEQMRRQRVLIDYWMGQLHISADRVAHVLLLPSKLPINGVVDKVVKWESVLDEYQIFGPAYWIAMLQTAISRYDELVTRRGGGKNADGRMTGMEIVEAHALGELDYAYTGRKDGLDGNLFADDLRTGHWRTRVYEVRYDPLPGKTNWFPISEFIARTALCPPRT
jgi:hypothetical protein